MNVNLSDLILYFVQQHPRVGRTQIVKFIYLSDLMSRQYFGKPLTGLNWIWHDFGPWDKEIYAVLSQMLKGKMVEESSFPGKDNTGYAYTAKATESARLPPEAEMIARHVWDQVNQKKLDELLNDVVYKSVPMLDVQKHGARGQRLRMELVDNELRKEQHIDPVEAWRGWHDSQEGRTVSLRDVMKELRGTP